MPEIFSDTVVSFHKSAYGDNWVASIRGIDVHESCDGYSAEELRHHAERIQYYANILDRINSSSNTPSLFDSL